MKSSTQLPILYLIFTIVLTTIIAKVNNAQDNPWELGPRTLPASVDVSDVFRESLLNTPTPDVSPMLNVPKTDEEWLALQMERDTKSESVARALAEALNIKVEEDKIGGVNVHWVTPSDIDEDHKNQLFVYIHGGAWYLNSGRAGTIEPVVIASRLKMPVVSIDYRLLPKYPAPAATDDVIAVWKELIKDHSPSSMVMGGTSAGGNITLSSVHRLKDLGLPLPGALYVGTPSVDLNWNGDSHFLNDGADRILLTTLSGQAVVLGVMYAGELGINDPYVSPIYGDFSNFPPTYIISGTRDILLSDAVRVHRALRRTGVEADLHIYEGQAHGDYIFVLNAPESFEHYAELNAFVLKHLQMPKLSDSILTTEKTEDIVIPSSSLH
jgi:acetyl esterase/lipase